MRGASLRHGFTLIELVMVIVLTGALFATASIFIVGPITAYADVSRRAALVDAADIALRRMARDIRAAVPNSVRVHPSGLAIEMLAITSGGRYRAAVDSSAASADPNTFLEFDSADSEFDLLGGFPGVTLPFGSNNHFLVVYNLGTAGSDVYEGSNVVSPAGTQIDIDASNHVTLDAGFRFAYASPQQRMFLSSGVVRYTCDPVGGNLTRRIGGGFVAASTPYVAGDGDLVTQNVAACAFQYQPGSASRSGVVTLNLTLSDGEETIRLLRQVQVENLP